MPHSPVPLCLHARAPRFVSGHLFSQSPACARWQAMGELCREMSDGTSDPDPKCMAGLRLPCYVLLYHLSETALLAAGWGFYANVQVAWGGTQDLRQ